MAVAPVITQTNAVPETPQATPAAPSADVVGDQPKPPDSAPDQTTKPDEGADTDQPKHELPRGVQKRIDRLTREKYRLQAELEVARRQPPQQADTRTTTTESNGEPKPDQFKSYEAFLEARAEWKAEQKVSALLGQAQESARRQHVEAEHSRLAQGWEERVGKASDVYDDFEEVALAPDLPITEPMMAALVRIEKGPDVAYYLGKHRDVATQIANLDPFSAAVRIGEIAATLSRPVPKKTTSAPEPINPVGGRSTTTKDPAQMSDSEFAAWRREQIKRR